MDRPPAIEELLRHRTWLRRLASSLVLDAARADDVVQETLLAALRRPPLDAGRPQAWLAAVARRIARGFARRDEGRARHERGAAQSEALPATDVVVARAALQQRVAAIVLALDEPYRTALLLRYVEELPPRAIARRTAVAVETARTRVKRGVERVRARLVAPEELVVLLAPRERKSLAVALAAPTTTGAALWEASVAGGVVMSSGAKLAAAALLVAAATATWWMSGRLAAPPAKAESGAKPAVASGDGATALQEAPTIAGERVAADATGEPRAGSDAWLAQLGLAVKPAPVDGLPVEVVDATSGRPAAGVAVLQLFDVALGPSRAIELLATPQRLPRAVLEVHRTDAAGTTRVAYRAGMGEAVLLALDGERRAAIKVGGPPLVPLTLRLRAAVAIAVEVVDRDGAPWAGVPVELGFSATGSQRLSTARSAVTDGDGRARLADVDVLRAPFAGAKWYVAAKRGLALAGAAAVELDLARLPADPVVLALGEAGAIEFEIVDEREVRVPFDGTLLINLERRDGSVNEREEIAFSDGRATLDPVGLGLRWIIWRNEGERSLATRSGAGPTSAGERQRAMLRAEPVGPLFVARLVDESGAPLAGRDFSSVERDIHDGSGTYSGHAARARTDANGELRLAFPAVALATFRRSLLLVARATADAAPRRAFLELPAQLERRSYPLGDVVARTLDLALSGRVVRDDGQPMAGVDVAIDWLDRSPTPLEWEEFGSPQTTTDDDGRFEIIGWPAGRYRVRCRADGYSAPRELAADATLELPARDVVFTVSPTRITGSAVLGSVVAPQLPTPLVRELTVRFRRADGEQAGAVAADAAIDDRGAFVWVAKERGLFDAEILPRGSDDPLDVVVRIGGVAVGDGATTIDPRLQQIDLAGRLRAIAITVVDDARRPVENALIVTRVAGSSPAPPRFAWSGRNGLQLLTLQPALDVEVFASGGRAASRRGVSGPVELTLAPATAAATTIRIEPAALAADPRFGFTVSALPDGGKFDGVADWLTAEIGPDGTATLTLPPLPRWRVRLLVHGREGTMRLVREQPPQWESLLELDPSGSAAALTLQVDAAAIDAFVKRMSEG